MSAVELKYAHAILSGAQGGNRTRTLLLERDFKSRVSTNSTTWALEKLLIYFPHLLTQNQPLLQLRKSAFYGRIRRLKNKNGSTRKTRNR
jgi:hypothetical protein